MKTSDYPVIIIGAGAAGLGASEQASKCGVEHIVLEASHRVGGRGLTEYLEDSIAVDLGCHWMHSASINPYREWADQLGREYSTGDSQYEIFRNKVWQDANSVHQAQQYSALAYESMLTHYQQNPATAISDTLDLQAVESDYFCHWMSLMHSNDVDQVAVQDAIEFTETHEDYPLKQGYGSLIAKQGEVAPVSLNSIVTEIQYDGSPIKVQTNQGLLLVEKVIVTVSTGVLAANQIKFSPGLPTTKQEAISALPMGNSNYLFFSLDAETFPSNEARNIHYQKDDSCFAIRLFEFNQPYVFTSSGGRYAWWLEKQSPAAMKQLFTDVLVDIFGSAVKSSLRQFKHSAWGFDSWIRGAYSSQLPGYKNMRQVLAQNVDEKIYFAGEATSRNELNTAHGAYLSGQRAVLEALQK